MDYFGVVSGQVSRKGWAFGLGLVFAAGLVLYFEAARVARPPKPAAASLPASARILLQPFHKDDLDLSVSAHGQSEYKIGMQAGTPLVYSWTASHGKVSCEFPGQRTALASEGHGAFVAQSSGWYVWRWTNPTGDAVAIHLKLNGYYEPAGMPPAGMHYDR